MCNYCHRLLSQQQQQPAQPQQTSQIHSGSTEPQPLSPSQSAEPPAPHAVVAEDIQQVPLVASRFQSRFGTTPNPWLTLNCREVTSVESNSSVGHPTSTLSPSGDNPQAEEHAESGRSLMSVHQKLLQSTEDLICATSGMD